MVTSKPRGRVALQAVGCVALLFAVGACATAGQRQSSFEDIQKKYTQLVRWSEFEEAANFVSEDQRQAYNEETGRLGPVRFVDYRIDRLDFDAETNEASVKVVYSAYKRSAPMAIAVEERQEWKRDDETDAWLVTSTFVEKPFEAERRY